MASISTDKSGNKLIRFRYGGREFTKSADTTEGKIAESTKARVEDTIRRLTQGWLQLPNDADVGEFIISGGSRVDKAKAEIVATSKPLTIADLFSRYDAEYPAGAKDASTMALERTHKKHLLKRMGGATKIDTLKHESFQKYANARSAEEWNGKPITPTTIAKEFSTFRVIWNWALRQGHIVVPLPFKVADIDFARTVDKPPFQTYGNIFKAINRGGLSDIEQAALWESLYLSLDEVHDALKHIKATATLPFVYPMLTFAAMTGARRSEICNSRVDDWNFDTMTVNLREKKRKKGKASFRVVEVNTFLAGVMRGYFDQHPGGQRTITLDGNPMTGGIASGYLKRALKSHDKWKRIPGFHTFRHSFASIMAHAGVHEAIIDKFMGHQTVEQRERYRHLFPKNRQQATELLSRPGL